MNKWLWNELNRALDKMTNYVKGANYERELINILKSHGYKAQRTAGSHSPFDIMLWKENADNKRIVWVAFLQAKIKKQKIYKEDQP